MVGRWGNRLGRWLAAAVTLACVCGASGGGLQSLPGRAKLHIERGAQTCGGGCSAALSALSSTLLSRLEPFSVKLPFGPRGAIMLSTDLDDTLVGDKMSLARFNDVWLAQLEPRGCKLVYNTGRSFDDYMLLAKEWALLVPDVFIGGCGSQIYTFDDYGRPIADRVWQHKLEKGWNKTAVADAAENTASLSERYGRITQKRESSKNPFMYSCKVLRADESMTVRGIIADFERCMRERGLAVKVGAASVAYSADSTVQGDVRPGQTYLYVDLLPRAAGKGNAQAYVQGLLGFTPQTTVVAGDSGNDVPMFTAGAVRGILVGNAKEELVAAKRCHHTRARRGYAAGVLEGLERLCVVDTEEEEKLANPPPRGAGDALLRLARLQ
mmetsp:Transcript_56388/g.136385  ORF Transcript_56388/g.136385 Transcript_56388/m.136385 type:complete len:382 (-) Transcript_56388:12-1157(-)